MFGIIADVAGIDNPLLASRQSMCRLRRSLNFHNNCLGLTNGRLLQLSLNNTGHLIAHSEKNVDARPSNPEYDQNDDVQEKSRRVKLENFISILTMRP